MGIRGENGFSLISLIVASGIGLIVAGGGMSTLSLLAKKVVRSNKILNKKVIDIDLKVEINKQCINFFENTTLQTTNSFIGESAEPQEVLLKTDSLFHKDQLKSQIQLLNEVTENQYLSEITLVDQSDTVRSQMLFYTTIESGKVTSCSEKPQYKDTTKMTLSDNELNCDVNATPIKGTCETRESESEGLVSIRSCMIPGSCGPWVKKDVYSLIKANAGKFVLRCRFRSGTARILMAYLHEPTNKLHMCYNRIRYSLQ